LESRVGSGFFVGLQRVLVLTHTSRRGKTSGLELGQMQTNNAALFHVRNGKVARLGVYWDRERVLTELWREGQEGWARDS
jgi:ketosteroid isomerase-like protein